MAQSDRGTKRRCGHCGAPFYDLDRRPIICPKCSQEFVPQVRLPSRSRAPAAVAAPQPVEIEEIDRFVEDEVLAPEADDDESAVDGTDGDEDGDEEELHD
jgi:uncharacterized protein (TIGR02300 family)